MDVFSAVSRYSIRRNHRHAMKKCYQQSWNSVTNNMLHVLWLKLIWKRRLLWEARRLSLITSFFNSNTIQIDFFFPHTQPRIYDQLRNIVVIITIVTSHFAESLLNHIHYNLCRTLTKVRIVGEFIFDEKKKQYCGKYGKGSNTAITNVTM